MVKGIVYQVVTLFLVSYISETSLAGCTSKQNLVLPYPLSSNEHPIMCEPWITTLLLLRTLHPCFTPCSASVINPSVIALVIATLMMWKQQAVPYMAVVLGMWADKVQQGVDHRVVEGFGTDIVLQQVADYTGVNTKPSIHDSQTRSARNDHPRSQSGPQILVLKTDGSFSNCGFRLSRRTNMNTRLVQTVSTVSLWKIIEQGFV